MQHDAADIIYGSYLLLFFVFICLFKSYIILIIYYIIIAFVLFIVPCITCLHKNFVKSDLNQKSLI